MTELDLRVSRRLGALSRPNSHGQPALFIRVGAPVWTLAWASPVDIRVLGVEQFDEVAQKDSSVSAAQVMQNVALSNEVQGLLEETMALSHFEEGLDSDAPIIRMVNAMIHEAVRKGASDIHLEPYERAATVRLRVDGVLTDLVSPPRHIYAALVSRIKIMAQLDIAERRLPQDGRLTVRWNEEVVDLRVSTLPTAFGERAVLRLLQKEVGHAELSGLGMSDAVFGNVEKVLSQPNGIFLITGPTGSGKTTTAYSAITHLKTSRENIMTVEDPVEYEIQGVSQTQVQPKIGLGFGQALRAILRQDPDILMIGEIRDAETAQIAVQAALTGHLVLATLHTNDAPSAITRLMDMGVEPYLLASTVRAVVAQRLLRKVCPQCKTVSSATKMAVANPKGCPACGQTGFKGRVGVYEFLACTQLVQEAVRAGSAAPDLRALAIRSGMTTLFEDAQRWLQKGVTTEDEVHRVISLSVDQPDLTS